MLKEKLKKLYIFSGLSDEELGIFAGVAKVKNCNKGDMIFFDTEPYMGFYIVNIGSVKIFKISKDGREHILHIINSGQSFAEVPLFENYDKIQEDEFRYPANAMALENGTQIIRIPAREFIELLENNPKICLKLLAGFAKRLRHLNRHIEEITLKDVTKRVAGFILMEFNNRTNKDLQSSIELNISKNDLASYLGTIIETLSRTFKKLQDTGIINVEGKTITINDIDKLKKIAS